MKLTAILFLASLPLVAAFFMGDTRTSGHINIHLAEDFGLVADCPAGVTDVHARVVYENQDKQRTTLKLHGDCSGSSVRLGTIIPDKIRKITVVLSSGELADFE